MTARRATATGDTNTRRARGARRAKRPARTSAQTKRTRRPWSSDRPLLFFPPLSSPLVRLSVSSRPLRVSRRHDKDTKGEDEAEKTRKVQSDQCVLSLLWPSISILLCPAVVYPHLDFRQRMDGVEEVVMEGRVFYFPCSFHHLLAADRTLMCPLHLPLLPSELSCGD